MEFDYSKLKGKIKEVFNTQEAFADAIEMNRVTLSLSLNNKREFSQSEMMKSCNALNLEPIDIPLYFFKLLV